VVHLPIGIFLLLAAWEVAGSLARSRRLAWLPTLGDSQRTFILVLGAAAALLAAALGWLLGGRGDYDATLVEQHQWLGFATAGAAMLLLAFRRSAVLYRVSLPLFVVLLAIAAHWGGKLTHGTDYFVSSLPPVIARLFGYQPAIPAKKPAVTFDNALVFENVVQPILKERCESCHGSASTKGGLRLDSWAALAKGGKHGPVLKPGDWAASPLLRRIDLPAEAKEHMPPKGKPQLANDDLTLLDWWVAIGGPHAGPVAALDLPPAVEDVLTVRLPGGAARAVPDRAATLQAAAGLGHQLGILIRPLTPDGPWLEVNARLAGKAFDDAALARLAPIAPAIQWLDLGTTAVTDAGLEALAPTRGMQRLHLDQTAITDAGLARLAGFKQLHYLNLRSTAVTDKGVATLRTLPRLRALYLWQTAVSPAAVKALGDSLVDPRRIERWKSQEAEIDRLIAAEHFEGNTGESLRPESKPVPDPTPPPASPAPDKKQTP